MRYITYLNLSSDSGVVNRLSLDTCIYYFERTTLLYKTKRENVCFIISSEYGNFNIILYSKECFGINNFTYVINTQYGCS